MTISSSFSSFGTNNTLQVSQNQPLLSTSPNKFNSNNSFLNPNLSSSFNGQSSNYLATSVNTSTVLTHTFQFEGCPW